MSTRPYIVYPSAETTSSVTITEMVARAAVNEPGQVSFGINNFVPGVFRPLHHHHTWELIIIDSGSEGPGFVFFDGEWWRVTPGSAVFVPKEYPHAWSCGNQKGFKMLWVYGGSRDEAGRVWDLESGAGVAISSEQEKNARLWSGK